MSKPPFDPLACATTPFGGLLSDLLRHGLDLDEVIRTLRSLGRWTELVDAQLLYCRRAEAVRVLLAMGRSTRSRRARGVSPR